MRKIEQEMIEAIKARKYYKNGNTKVDYTEYGDCEVYLDGHTIASIVKKSIPSTKKVLYLYDCGFQTKTTKSRLNCLLSHYNLPMIKAKNFQWYCGDELWIGSKTFDLSQKETEEEAKTLKSGLSLTF